MATATTARTATPVRPTRTQTEDFMSGSFLEADDLDNWVWETAEGFREFALF